MALGADSAHNRNEYQESSWEISEAAPADLTAICEPIAYKMWEL
jgi:hypothetical protein